MNYIKITNGCLGVNIPPPQRMNVCAFICVKKKTKKKPLRTVDLVIFLVAALKNTVYLKVLVG